MIENGRFLRGQWCVPEWQWTPKKKLSSNKLVQVQLQEERRRKGRGENWIPCSWNWWKRGRKTMFYSDFHLFFLDACKMITDARGVHVEASSSSHVTSHVTSHVPIPSEVTNEADMHEWWKERGGIPFSFYDLSFFFKVLYTEGRGSLIEPSFQVLDLLALIHSSGYSVMRLYFVY